MSKNICRLWKLLRKLSGKMSCFHFSTIINKSNPRQSKSPWAPPPRPPSTPLTLTPCALMQGKRKFDLSHMKGFSAQIIVTYLNASTKIEFRKSFLGIKWTHKSMALKVRVVSLDPGPKHGKRCWEWADQKVPQMFTAENTQLLWRGSITVRVTSCLTSKYVTNSA